MAFYPDTNKPRYFAYGGEQVPLSLWSLRKTLERDSEPAKTTATKPAEDDDQDAQAAAGKKRRASSQTGKQRDLLPGELWRAKNLPNDALSLARHPLIRSVVFLPRNSASEAEASEDELSALDAAVAVGTKDGIVRVYEPSKKKPKHVHEWQVAPKNQGALRVLKLARSDSILFAGDSARNLYAIDAKTGRLLFQYKGTLFLWLTPEITGTISSLLVLHVQRDEEPPKTLLLGSSLDCLVRLFDIGTPYGNGQRRRGKELCSNFTGLENVISMASDQLSVQVPSEKKAEEAEEEEVWTNMAIARDGKDDGDASDAEEKPKVKQAKRRRSGAT